MLVVRDSPGCSPPAALAERRACTTGTAGWSTTSGEGEDRGQVAGEGEAQEDFESWYLDSRASLFAAAYFYVGDRNDAADLTQETYARAWQHWDQVGQHPNRDAWSREVLHNLVVSRWRRLRREMSRATSRPVAVDPPDVVHLDLVRLVSRLPVQQRRAVILHDIVDLTVDDVAAEMNAPAGTVRSWLSRARATLASQREDAPPEGEEVH